MKRLSKVQSYVLLVAGGVIFPLGLAPFKLWPAVIVSIAILFQSLHQPSIKRAFFNAMAYGFGLFIAGASWLYVSIHEYGFIAAPLAVIATTLFCLFLAAIFAAPFIFAAFLPSTPIALMLGLPAIWVLSEWVRTWIFTGFPWLYAGYSHTDTWLNGWAPIGGVLWLSFITALAAVLFLWLVLGMGKRRSTLGLCAMLATLTVSGYFLQQVKWTEDLGDPITVAIIQPNIPQNEKWSVQKQRVILNQLAAQTEPYWGHDLIIWPEAAVPSIPQRIPEFMQGMESRSVDSDSILLTGIITYQAEPRRYYSSVLAIGAEQGQYHKTRLVPFGEYVPLESLLRGLIKFFDLPMSSLSIGPHNQAPLSVKEQLIATAICYEVVYPDLVARNSKGASLILTVSNDTWFGESLGPLQHMQMVQMRALENSKPIIRGTNNGISGLVDHRGGVYQRMNQNSIAELSGIVQPRAGQTPFSMTGSWPAVFMSLLIVCFLVVNRTKINILEDSKNEIK
ncbi:apolipoprotein N-acyltransferase [Gammaproteobacteria bacterium]|nr:apolipoprotein N-acyltransferase [Gammaproteobacteria bacterium]|tara:strand:- start:957 stop:2477 length:1521 start_codon:yes stop_codon:yes gene_type:complete